MIPSETAIAGYLKPWAYRNDKETDTPISYVFKRGRDYTIGEIHRDCFFSFSSQVSSGPLDCSTSANASSPDYLVRLFSVQLDNHLFPRVGSFLVVYYHLIRRLFSIKGEVE